MKRFQLEPNLLHVFMFYAFDILSFKLVYALVMMAMDVEKANIHVSRIAYLKVAILY